MQIFTALLFCSQEVMMALMHGEVLISTTLGELHSVFRNACFLRGNYASAYDVVCPFFDDVHKGLIPLMYLVM